MLGQVNVIWVRVRWPALNVLEHGCPVRHADLLFNKPELCLFIWMSRIAPVHNIISLIIWQSLQISQQIWKRDTCYSSLRRSLCLRGDRVALIVPSPRPLQCLAELGFSLLRLVVHGGNRGTFHVHKCLFLFSSAPLPTSAPLYLILHSATFHVSCRHVIPASLLSAIPSISFHERHMLTSPSVRIGTPRDGILSSKRLLVSGSTLSSCCRPVHARPRRSKSRSGRSAQPHSRKWTDL